MQIIIIFIKNNYDDEIEMKEIKTENNAMIIINAIN